MFKPEDWLEDKGERIRMMETEINGKIQENKKRKGKLVRPINCKQILGELLFLFSIQFFSKLHCNTEIFYVINCTRVIHCVDVPLGGGASWALFEVYKMTSC